MEVNCGLALFAKQMGNFGTVVLYAPLSNFLLGMNSCYQHTLLLYLFFFNPVKRGHRRSSFCCC